MSSVFSSRNFYWDGGMTLAGEQGVGAAARLPPNKCVEKRLDFKTNTEVL